MHQSCNRETVNSQFLNQDSFHFNHSIVPQFSLILESFIHGIMLSRTFRVKEKVILSLTSDWSVKIKWYDWPGPAIFTVPEDRKENAAA